MLYLAQPSHAADQHCLSSHAEFLAQTAVGGSDLVNVEAKGNYPKLLGPPYLKVLCNLATLLLADRDDVVGANPGQ